jgi:succinyl-diaminopimelate desuccinylase
MKRREACLALLAAFCLDGCSSIPGGSDLARIYDRDLADRLVPLLTETVRIETVAGNAKAIAEQKLWVERVAGELGFTFRDAGKMWEVDFTGPPGAPVLGLAVHSDVVPADKAKWSFPPFDLTVRDGMVQGRGVIDDKGPMVVALLAMKALKESGKVRTHTVRLIVGTEEESTFNDIREYVKSQKSPDLSLVLDANFPVLIGEMAVNMLTVETALHDRAQAPVRLKSLAAGLAVNIVPDTAIAKIESVSGNATVLDALEKRLAARTMPDGTALQTDREGAMLVVRARGKSSHAGVNPTGGRNALVALASALEDELGAGGARDLLSFTRLSGQDLHGTGLGLTESHALFGRAVVVPTMVREMDEGKLRLFVNIRSYPGMSGDTLKSHLTTKVREFNERTGGALEPAGTFSAQPFVLDPESKIVKRLMAAYRRSTGRNDPPGVTAGGTYAKVLPNAIVFGMFFPGKPYPGHDVDEKVSLAELHLGAHALLEALEDIACGPPMIEPFRP